LPVGYALPVVFVALGTLLALAPRRRPRAVASLSYLSAAVFNELPFLVFAFLLASTLLALGQGDIHGPAGAAGIGVAGLTSGGLALVAWRARQTRPTLDRALADGLGDDWRAEIEPGLAAGLRRRPPLVRILFLPFPFRPRGIERVANIRYGDAGSRQTLDLYRRRSGPDSRPVLIHLHGGGFRRGRKSRQSRPLLYRLAHQGWICVSANYRLKPSVQLADEVRDVEATVAWVRANSREYGADPRQIFLAGSSAGAHLAAFAALTADAESPVAAVICLGGYYGPVDHSASLSAARAHAAPTTPPMFVLHGKLDTLVPVESARQFAAAVRRGSPNATVYAELSSGQHVLDLFHSIRFEAVVDGIEAFNAWVRSRV
jgi:acetyl esterase/lipase